MSEQLKKDLQKEIAEGNVVVVVGAGVSIASTDRAPVASWDGLIKDGVRYCREVAGAPEQWANLRLAQIETGDTDELITAAEHITTRLGGREGGEYARWLKESIGSLSIKDSALLKAIGNIGAPIVTTNYDSLLEQATGLPYVTWKEPRKIDDFIRDKRQAVVHIHGHWDEPGSVILGVRSYEDIFGDESAQSALRTLLSMRTLLFVGVGVAGGLSDPNFGALREWIARVHRTSTHRHYVLVKDDEVEAARTLLPLEGRIVPIGYGPSHGDLPEFLQTLVPVKPGPTPPPDVPSEVETLTPYLRSVVEKYQEWRGLYVELEGQTTERGERALRSRLSALIEPEVVEHVAQSFGQPQLVKLDSLFELVDKPYNAMLLGEPGSGKTTAFKRIALKVADDALHGLLPLPTVGEAEYSGGRIPILLPLSSLQNADVERWVREGCGLLAPYLDGYLESGRCLFLWDAFNEMPFESERQYTAKLNALVQFMANHPDNRFIWSCRRLDYRESLPLHQVELLPLSDEKIRQFFQNLAEVGEGEACDALLGRLEADRRRGRVLWELFKRPLMLELLCAVYEYHRQIGAAEPIPNNRGKLFEAFVNALMERERKRGGPLSRRYPPEVQKIALGQLAFAMMDATGPAAGVQARSGMAVPINWARAHLPQTCYDDSQNRTVDVTPDDLIDLAAGETILELPPNRSPVRFWHQSLQEYFAALELQKRLDSGEGLSSLSEAKDLTRVLKPPWWWEREAPAFVRTTENRWDPLPPPDPTGWEETVILLSGIHPAVDALIREVLPKNPILAGRCLLEGLDEGAVARLGSVKTEVVNALVQTVEAPDVALRVRIAAGDVLGFLGDPRIPDPLDLKAMIHIPAGEFLMGTTPQQVQQLLRENPDWKAEWFKNEPPRRCIYLDEYWIDKYPVTNSQYRQFIKATGYPNKPRYWDEPPFNKPNQPVVGVTWYDAMAYCEWAGKRLPTEAEWEKAARGTDGQMYPWGDEPPDHRRANYDLYVGKTTPVGLYPSGVSPYGAMDMAGGVWEWCLDKYQKNLYARRKKKNPFASGNIHDVINNFTTVKTRRVLRGGSWLNDPGSLRVASRFRDIPDGGDDVVGFRGASPRVPSFGS